MADDENINESATDHNQLPKRRKHRKLVAAVITVITLALVAIGWVLIRFSRQAQPTTASVAKASTPTVMTTSVVSQTANKELRLPAELRAYQNVAIYPKVQGFVESINVDRGSVVKRGQLLMRMSAPELASHTSEAEARVRAVQQQRLEMESRVQSVREQRAEAEAKLAAD